MIAKISAVFPNANHVMLESLDESTDIDVWRFARQNSYTIVTKDSDFNDLAIYKGYTTQNHLAKNWKLQSCSNNKDFNR